MLSSKALMLAALLIGLLALCEGASAANGRPSGSVGSTSKFNLFSRFRKAKLPLTPPEPTLLEQIEQHVHVPEDIRVLWHEGVHRGWVNPRTGLGTVTDGFRHKRENELVGTLEKRLGPYIEQAAKHLPPVRFVKP